MQFGQQHKKQEKEMSVIDRQAMAKSGLRWSFAEAARGKKVLLDEKLGGRGCFNAITPGLLVYIKENKCNQRFLCDAGAPVGARWSTQ
jgi:hypothetical protein